MRTTRELSAISIVVRLNYIRWLYEGFLSLLLAWMFIWVNRIRGFGHTGGIFDQMGQVKIFPYWENSKLLSYLYWRRIIVEPGTVLEQVIWSFVLASMIFLVFRALARFGIMSTLLRTIGGALALSGLPFFYLFDLFSPSRSFLLNTERITTFSLLVWIELTFVLGGAIVYYLQRRRVSLLMVASVLVFHFCSWGWLTKNYTNPLSLIHIYQMQGYHIWSPGLWISATFHLGFPVFGFFASLLWAFFAKLPSNPESQTLARRAAIDAT